MIYEFAVDPAVAAGWHDRHAYRFFKGSFGLGKKRILAQYPGTKWKQMVMREFHEMFRDRDPVAKQNAKLKLDALLRHLTEASSNRNRPCPGPWVDGALAEHQRRRFQGILVHSAGDEPFIDASTLDDDDPSWNPAEIRVDRSAFAITRALMPMLRHARKLIFIDPYIEPGDDRYSSVLTAIVSEAQKNREADEAVSVEVHTAVDREFRAGGKLQTPDAEQREAEALVQRIQETLRPHLGSGARLAVVIWSDKNVQIQGELIHNRYLLCERGGVMFGHGLDAGKGKDTLTVLAAEPFREVRSIYNEGAKVLRLVVAAEITSP